MIKISFVGDLSLGEHYFSFGHGPRSSIERGESIFDSVTETLSKSDLVFGNLEGPISDANYDPQSPHSRVFRGAPASVKQLKSAGFNVLSVANNHIIQHGEEAFLESVKSLEDSGITVIGLSSKPVTYITTTKGNIIVIACSLIPDNTNKHQDFYFTPSERELIDTVRLASVDGTPILVYIHWGTEGSTLASPAQKKLAKDLEDAGAQLIIGHHTHTLQPILITENSLVAFSLGNFVFDLPWSNTNKESVILEICVSQNKLHDICYHRVRLEDNGRPIFLNESIRINMGEHILSKNSKTHSTNEALAKLCFFLKNLPKGSTMVKLRFLIWKLRRKLA